MKTKSFKRIVSIVCTIALLISMCSVSLTSAYYSEVSAGNNKVYSTSFEGSTFGTGSSSTAVTPSQDKANSGTYSLKFAPTSSNNFKSFIPLDGSASTSTGGDYDVEANKTYKVEYYYYINSIASTANSYLTLYKASGGNVWASPVEINPVDNRNNLVGKETGKWIKFETIFKATASGNIVMALQGTNGDVVYVDDFSMFEVATSSFVVDFEKYYARSYDATGELVNNTSAARTSRGYVKDKIDNTGATSRVLEFTSPANTGDTKVELSDASDLVKVKAGYEYTVTVNYKVTNCEGTTVQLGFITSKYNSYENGKKVEKVRTESAPTEWKSFTYTYTPDDANAGQVLNLLVRQSVNKSATTVLFDNIVVVESKKGDTTTMHITPTVVETKALVEGTVFAEPEIPYASGFLGWYADPEFTTPVETSSAATPNVYAKWETVYDTNGFTNIPATSIANFALSSASYATDELTGSNVLKIVPASGRQYFVLPASDVATDLKGYELKLNTTYEITYSYRLANGSSVELALCASSSDFKGYAGTGNKTDFNNGIAFNTNNVKTSSKEWQTYNGTLVIGNEYPHYSKASDGEANICKYLALTTYGASGVSVYIDNILIKESTDANITYDVNGVQTEDTLGKGDVLPTLGLNAAGEGFMGWYTTSNFEEGTKVTEAVAGTYTLFARYPSVSMDAENTTIGFPSSAVNVVAAFVADPLDQANNVYKLYQSSSSAGGMLLRSESDGASYIFKKGVTYKMSFKAMVSGSETFEGKGVGMALTPAEGFGGSTKRDVANQKSFNYFATDDFDKWIDFSFEWTYTSDYDFVAIRKSTSETAGYVSIYLDDFVITEVSDETEEYLPIENNTVTLNANGGTVTGETVLEFTDVTQISLPTPVREGYIFGGWFVNAADADASTVYTSYWSDKSSPMETIVTNKNTDYELVAKWISVEASELSAQNVSATNNGLTSEKLSSNVNLASGNGTTTGFKVENDNEIRGVFTSVANNYKLNLADENGWYMVSQGYTYTISGKYKVNDLSTASGNQGTAIFGFGRCVANGSNVVALQGSNAQSQSTVATATAVSEEWVEFTYTVKVDGIYDNGKNGGAEQSKYKSQLALVVYTGDISFTDMQITADSWSSDAVVVEGEGEVEVDYINGTVTATPADGYVVAIKGVYVSMVRDAGEKFVKTSKNYTFDAENPFVDATVNPTTGEVTGAASSSGWGETQYLSREQECFYSENNVYDISSYTVGTQGSKVESQNGYFTYFEEEVDGEMVETEVVKTAVYVTTTRYSYETNYNPAAYSIYVEFVPADEVAPEIVGTSVRGYGMEDDTFVSAGLRFRGRVLVTEDVEEVGFIAVPVGMLGADESLTFDENGNVNAMFAVTGVADLENAYAEFGSYSDFQMIITGLNSEADTEGLLSYQMGAVMYVKYADGSYKYTSRTTTTWDNVFDEYTAEQQADLLK